MQRCLELAQRAKGHTAPNPMVGAVLVHDGRVIGEGWHEHYGGPHAEVNCINNVAEADKQLIPQSTMYVNLEPCAHFGKTPPCANRIVQERNPHVVIANKDPFAKVNGNGIGILQDAGITVEIDILADAGAWLNRRFFCFHTLRRPYIILKWAQSTDGYIAPATRERIQISNPKAQVLLHQWRTQEAAIMVGYNTALQDDPQLTARHWQGPQPLRIVTNSHLQLPTTHRLLDANADTWVLNAQKELQQDNINYISINVDNEPLQQLMQLLYKAQKLSLIVEGGAALLNSFITAGLWDEARIFTGSKPMGDGLLAPRIPAAYRAMETPIADNTLQLYVNPANAYPYVNGMEL